MAEPEAAAKAAFAAGRYDEAAALFEAALGRDDAATPRHLLLCNLSASLHKLDRHGAAAQAAREAISMEPRHAKAHYRLASALLAGGNTLSAMQVCDAALLLLPDHKQLLVVREACRAAAPPADAPAAGATAADDAREYQRTCRETGKHFYAAGEHGQAAAWYGHALAAAEEAADAAEAGEAAEASRRERATLLSNRAASLLQLRQFGAAAADCRRAVGLDASQFKAWIRGAAALLHLGDARRARARPCALSG